MNKSYFAGFALFSAFYFAAMASAYGNKWEDDWDKKVVELSKKDFIVNAAKELIPAFTTFREENGIDAVDTQKEAVGEYYNGTFAKQYKQISGDEHGDINSLLEPLDDDAIALQYYYMAANPKPVDAKQMLDKADDKSTWTQSHAKYHPLIREALEANELYDIFIIDSKSGDIIYSVFKEIDFATNVLKGPYADAFKDDFTKTNDAKENDFAAHFFSIYTPSYDEVAYFFMSPIFDGDQKIAVLLIQVPL